MNTSIVRKSFLKSDEYIELNKDAKSMYLYLLMSPDKGYLDVYKFEKHLAMLITGMPYDEIKKALAELKEHKFIDFYEGYIGLLKRHASTVGGQFGGLNTERELESLPKEIRDHFAVCLRPSRAVKGPKGKPGPAPDTIEDIIKKQPEDIQAQLTDLVEDRKERKKPPTTRAVRGWITKLEKMYPKDPKKQAECVQQSIDRGWMGLFEIKEDINKQDRKFM